MNLCYVWNSKDGERKREQKTNVTQNDRRVNDLIVRAREKKRWWNYKILNAPI